MNKLTEITFPNLERRIIGLTAITAGITLLIISASGPTGFNKIIYKTSPSSIYQIIGQDIANIILLAPLCLVGGIAHLRQKKWAKYLLILTPIYLFYMGLSYGIGMEWTMQEYSGNSHNYFFLFVILMISSLILLIGTLPLFSENDAPEFNRSSLNIYSLLMILFLLIFSKMWIDQVIQVIKYGDTSNGSYSSSPNLFWVIRYLDLGFTIPLGFISIYLLWSRPKRTYPVIQLFFGFFITMITTVNCMGISMLLNNDPEIVIADMFVFIILAILSYTGYFYLMKNIKS